MSSSPPKFAPGDVLAFSGRGCLSRAIQFCTLGTINHVAILSLPPQGDGLCIYESSATVDLSCEAAGKVVKGVQRHSVRLRLRYAARQGCRVWHYPLTVPLTEDQQRLLESSCRTKLDIPYDYKGAAWARTLGFGWLAHLLKNREALGNLMCSEFAAVELRLMDRFDTENASKWNPAWLCRVLRWQGIVQKPRLVVAGGKVLV